MVEDPDDKEFFDDNSGGGGNQPNPGKGGGIASFLPLILSLLFKKPKILIPIVIIGAVIYYFGGCGSLMPPADNQNNSAFSTGGVLKPEEYAKSDIFNFLYEDNKTNPLPEAVSLLKYCPDRLNQGAQGSCVAWSNAYSIRTILYAQQTGKDPNSVAFSPSYLYNNIKLDDNCQGSYINRAVDWMSDKGAVPFSDFKYDERTCSQDVPMALDDKAANFRIKGAQRLGENPESGLTIKDILQIKHALNAGSPVAIGMMVGGSFMQEMMGQKVWHPTRSDYQQMGFGGHAMTVIGYDDNLEGGALQIMNSWGPEWGDNGVAWVKYGDFVSFTREAYAYAPMGKVNQPIPDIFDVNFSLFNPKTKEDISLEHLGNGRFRTRSKMAVGTPFKVKFKNNVECYSYIFGQETDKSCYVLYPYSPKHSPYCGVTGTRVFPRGYNMQPDDKGTSDFIAVLISREPRNFEDIKAKVNASGKPDFGDAFEAALNGTLLSGIQYKTAESVAFTADSKSKKDVLIVIEVTK